MHLDRRLVELAWGRRAGFLAAIGLGWAGAVVVVAQAWLLASIIDAVMLHGAGLAEVKGSLLVLAGALGLRMILSWSTDVVSHQAAAAVVVDLRRRLLAHLFRCGPLATAGDSAGETTSTVVEGLEGLHAHLGDYLPQVVRAALIPVTVAAFVLLADRLSALILVLTAPLIPLFMTLVGNLAEARARAQWHALSRLGGALLDAVQGLPTLCLLGRSRDRIEALGQASRDLGHRTMGVLRIAFLSAAILEAVATLSTAVVAVTVGVRLLGGQLEFVHAFFVLLLAPETYLPLRRLGAGFHAGLAGVNAAGRVFELLDRPTRPVPERAHQPIPARLTITFHEVHVAYPSAPDRAVLRGLSLVVEHGRTVALVGDSGGGKSTVARVVLRLLDPDRGTLTVDGRPLAELPPAAWRQRLAWVPERPYLMAGTIADNIRLARPDAGDAEVTAAARRVGVHDVLSALPDGYATRVGERGATVSGGQARLIALARAMLRDPPLVVIDEGTADLDPELQEQVVAALRRLLENRTGLLIAHRLPVLRLADRIAVVAHGRVVEHGSLELLTAAGGSFSRLATAYGGSG